MLVLNCTYSFCWVGDIFVSVLEIVRFVRTIRRSTSGLWGRTSFVVTFKKYLKQLMKTTLCARSDDHFVRNISYTTLHEDARAVSFSRDNYIIVVAKFDRERWRGDFGKVLREVRKLPNSLWNIYDVLIQYVKIHRY